MAPFADFVFELALRLAEVAPDPAEMLLMEAVIAFSGTDFFLYRRKLGSSVMQLEWIVISKQITRKMLQFT